MMKMKNTLMGLALAGLGLMAGINTAWAGATLDRVMARKTVVVVADGSYPPFSFMNDKNQMDGLDVELAKLVAQRLGVTLRFETPSWEVVTAGNWRGRWDVCICSMTPDQKRARVLDFVTAYYDSPTVVVTSVGNTELKKAADINGKRIGVEQGSSYERYLQRDLEMGIFSSRKVNYPFEKVRIAPYSSEDLAYQDLALGAGKRIDAVVSNMGAARFRMSKVPGKFQIVGEPLYNEENWIVVDKGDAEWKQKIQAVFAELKADGSIDRLTKKWIGVPATSPAAK
ncbi:transporter substrate-binding domain-containing protein [Zoogloea sp.]|uniref:transporter substrate-binding domain-containing protein n=2 Tax=Zoogloea sp. TaxID=49181 RepID=UPI0035B4170D